MSTVDVFQLFQCFMNPDQKAAIKEECSLFYNAVINELKVVLELIASEDSGTALVGCALAKIMMPIIEQAFKEAREHAEMERAKSELKTKPPKH